MSVQIHVGDCRDVLRTLADESVQCCITSPPYWGLRDYQVDGQIGLEPMPGLYVESLVDVFREVRRVLRNDGVLWLNLGDSYNSNPSNMQDGIVYRDGYNQGYDNIGRLKRDVPGLKPKDLIGIPWRVAFALRTDGWWLRSDIIWSKPNCMPESVTDRPTKAHEYVFLLSKSARYFYDADAIAEPSHSEGRIPGGNHKLDTSRNDGNWDMTIPVAPTRNKRTVWTIPTQPYREAHFATFPPALVEPMVKAGTSERGGCPECGAPWKRVTEKVGKSTYQRIKDEQGIGHLDMKHEAEKRGVALKAGAEGWGGTRNADGTTPHFDTRESITTGWRPTCECGESISDDIVQRLEYPLDSYGPQASMEPVPCAVLDPFAGAGTVGLVADRLGRDAILIELSPTYAEMMRNRIQGEAPMFVDITMHNSTL